MVIKTPLADEVFQRWLKSKPANDIEKVFGRKPQDISAMECVGKEIVKTPALVFRTTAKNVSSSKKPEKSDLYTYDELEKQKFYKFSKSIPKNDWKEKNTDVMLYEKIEEVTCKDCGKKGLVKCDKCNGTGTVVCPNCKDAKSLLCKECKGAGSITLDINVYDETGKKVDTKQRKLACPECHGRAKSICQECGGTTKQLCKSCNGEGGFDCKTCKGTGVVYNLPLSPVPFSDLGDVYFFWDTEMEKQMSKSKTLKGKELADLLEKQNVSPVKVNNTNDLDQKKLEDQLGFWHKEASKQVSDCKKTFSDLQKSNAETP